MNTIKLGEKEIGKDQPVFVIAEIGINHEGSIKKCEQMIRDASDAGADAVKLQTIDADANYVKGSESHQLFKKSELSIEETGEMFDLARTYGLEPFTTSGDIPTIDKVETLNPVAYKISSGLMTNIPIIRHLACLKRPLLVSTGLAKIGEIDEVVEIIRLNNMQDQFGLFQCTAEYPAPLESLNLRTISWLQERYECPVGFSDHSEGIDASFLCVAAGAMMIEKHFTFDRNRKSYDHAISLEKKEFKKMITKIRKAERMLGQAEKTISKLEKQKRELMHRVLVAKIPIKKGDFFNEDNVTFKRPLAGNLGMAPLEYDNIIGKISLIDLEHDQMINKKMIGV
jgi:N,N'-diacetyllegionaminate synthase